MIRNLSYHKTSIYARINCVMFCLLLVFSLSIFSSVINHNNTVLASGSVVLADVEYDYTFVGVVQPVVRGKSFWYGKDISCAGGEAIPGGTPIIVTGVQQGSTPATRMFRYWFFPNGTDSLVTINMANVSIENAPPNGWGIGGQPNPIAACTILHDAGDSTYRLKTMFVSDSGNGRYTLSLLDTGINLVLTPR